MKKLAQIKQESFDKNQTVSNTTAIKGGLLYNSLSQYDPWNALPVPNMPSLDKRKP